MRASIIVRTYNEEELLEELLKKLEFQNNIRRDEYELILVDSGSTDSTISIAKRYVDRIEYIDKEHFSFGRSLNMGCEVAIGNILVFISAHCIPTDDRWFSNLISAIERDEAEYVYGRQIGASTTKFSENILFEKFYPLETEIPKKEIFLNNANAALKTECWSALRFDEKLTGLEDMEMGKRLVAKGCRIGYVAEAAVYHIHNETWQKVKNRYERESRALESIFPEIRFNVYDLLYFTAVAIFYDLCVSIKMGRFFSVFIEIVLFRCMQYWGTYIGHHDHRKISEKKKKSYFYVK